MNKNVLIGAAAFGGLILLVTILPKTPAADNESIETEVEAQKTLPSAVASGFPTYPGAKVDNVDETTNDEGKVFYSLRLITTDSIADINEWYREALSHGGWNIKSDQNFGGYQLIQAERSNLYTSMQAANGEDGTVVISQQAQIRP